MTTEQKALAIIEAIVAQCQDGSLGVGFLPDEGGNSLTLYVGRLHCHIGRPSITITELVYHLHRELMALVAK